MRESQTRFNWHLDKRRGQGVWDAMAEKEGEY